MIRSTFIPAGRSHAHSVTGKRFNRYEALISEYYRLQQSKIDFLLSATQEIDRLRLFIQFLSRNEPNTLASSDDDSSKPTAQSLLQKIKSFDLKSEFYVSNSSTPHSNLNNNNNNSNTNNNAFISPEISENTDIGLIQNEIGRLRESKLKLVVNMNNEIDHLRSIIIDYSKKYTKIRQEMDTNEYKNEHNELKEQEDEINYLYARQYAVNQKQRNIDMKTMWHDYQKLGQDDVVNVFLVGTKCSGKTTLMKHLLLEFGSKESIKKEIYENNLLYNQIINSMVSCVYNTLADNHFFGDSNHGGKVAESVSYFESNHLSNYNAPFLTHSIETHLKNLMNDNEIDNDNDDEPTISGINRKDDNMTDLLMSCMDESTYYNTMSSLYENIEKYAKRTWYYDMTRKEILNVWERNEINSKLIRYCDIELPTTKNPNETKIYRFWDIDSLLFFSHAKEYKMTRDESNLTSSDKDLVNNNNLNEFFECVVPQCFVYLTSPIFAYQFEKINFKHYYSSMHVSLQLFKTLFVTNIDIAPPDANEFNGNENLVLPDSDSEDNIDLNANETHNQSNLNVRNHNNHNSSRRASAALYDMLVALESDEKETLEERRQLSKRNLIMNNTYNLNNIDVTQHVRIETVNNNNLFDAADLLDEDITDMNDIIEDNDIVEDCNFDGLFWDQDDLISKWSKERIPIICLFNKCDILLKDIHNKNRLGQKQQRKNILVSFPSYDGDHTYDDVIFYLKTMFKSFDVDHKRPFHIYDTCLLSSQRVKSVLHHIQSIVELQGAVVNI